MNIDIRLSLEFFDHPKTKKLKKRLGDEGVLCLLRLWMWAAKNRSTGQLVGLDAEDVELAADWQGAEGAFFEALVALRWIDTDGETFALHGWEENQAYAVKSEERSNAAKKAAEARWKKDRPASVENADACATDAEGMRTACAPHADECAPHAKGNAPETRNQYNIYTPLCTTYTCPPTGDAVEVPAPEKPSRKRFVKPTVEEVAAYCAERGNDVDAEAFVAFYDSNGWRVGKNPMRDWKGAVRTWEQRRREDQRVTPGHVPRPATVGQQRWAEEKELAQMVLASQYREREERKHARQVGTLGIGNPAVISLPEEFQ